MDELSVLLCIGAAEQWECAFDKARGKTVNGKIKTKKPPCGGLF
jgi:hypothetical protein